jgi:D-glycero-alpha-D-manno-heptose-7-phosphate kinase
MIITKTPFRVSLFGGGTDYAEFFKNYDEGIVVGLAIDKYAQIILRKLPKFFDYHSRICYYQIETVDDNAKIEHKAVRNILKHMNYEEGIELMYSADLPARSGIGSSSTFTVGLIQALKCLQGHYHTKEELANIALHMEHDVLQENVGYQDQIFAAHGGFNVIKFNKYGYVIRPVITTREFITELEASLMLVYTGIKRNSSEIVGSYLQDFSQKLDELRTIKKIVEKSLRVIENKDIRGLGRLLDESWKFKRSLSKNITTPVIDELYASALDAGAYGGKIMGGGGGGFMLLMVDPLKRARVKAALGNLVTVDPSISWNGSEVIYATR